MHTKTFFIIFDQGTVDSSSQINTIDWTTAVICTCNTAEVVCIKHFNPDQLPPLEHRTDWPHSVAKNIFQSCEYCLQGEMLGLGRQMIAPKLQLVLDSLG